MRTKGTVKWFSDPFDTIPYFIGPVYNTPPLYGDETSYVRAYNASCESIVARLELKVNQKPSITSIRHDSIDRSSFMPGVILACRSVGARTGLVIGLDKLMEA